MLPVLDGWLPRLAGLVLSEQATDELLALVVSLALQAVDGADGASVALVGDGTYRLGNPSASDLDVHRLDEAQRLSGAGPCIDVFRSGEEAWWEPGDGRWPHLAAQAGCRVLWVLPLHAADHLVGILGLHFRSEPPTIEAAATARHLARYAGVVLHNAAALIGAELTSRHLQTALENRDVIGQAKGMLMARRGVDADEAFDLLRRASQRSGRKLRDVAAEVVARYGPPRGP